MTLRDVKFLVSFKTMEQKSKHELTTKLKIRMNYKTEILKKQK